MSRSKYPGLFITFEGVEGCGKSTQATALLASLLADGVPAILSREPGGTPVGERCSDILLDIGNTGMQPAAELFLYLASRAEHVARVILPRLERARSSYPIDSATPAWRIRAADGAWAPRRSKR